MIDQFEQDTGFKQESDQNQCNAKQQWVKESSYDADQLA